MATFKIGDRVRYTQTAIKLYTGRGEPSGGTEAARRGLGSVRYTVVPNTTENVLAPFYSLVQMDGPGKPFPCPVRDLELDE